MHQLTDGAADFTIEEVYGWKKHYFEVYVTKAGHVLKYEVLPAGASVAS